MTLPGHLIFNQETNQYGFFLNLSFIFRVRISNSLKEHVVVNALYSWIMWADLFDTKDPWNLNLNHSYAFLYIHCESRLFRHRNSFWIPLYVRNIHSITIYWETVIMTKLPWVTSQEIKLGAKMTSDLCHIIPHLHNNGWMLEQIANDYEPTDCELKANKNIAM